MSHRTLAMAVAVIVLAAPFLIAQAAKPDAKELAAVERIRARIEERSKKTAADKPAAYKVTIPNTTVSYGMAPIPAGEFTMGSSAPGARPDEQPAHKVKVDAFWMQTHEVTWDAYLMFMFADQARERDHPDAVVDALSRPTAPHLEMSFGRGNSGFPAISMTQHAANKFAQWLSAKTGEFYRLPTEAEWEYACRAGVDAPPAAEPARRAGVVQEELAAGRVHVRHLPHDRHEEAECRGDSTTCSATSWSGRSTSTRPTLPRRSRIPWVRATKAYPHAVRGGSWKDDAPAVTCTARVASEASWKRQDPQLPKSVWYMTDAQWLGFRLVRPAALPSAEEMYRAWNNGVELDPY